jgi:epoxyqueuosine reductase QueG
MKLQIIGEIRRFVMESEANRFPNSDEPYFVGPLAGFASAEDPIFTEYKHIIGEFHQTPQEVMSSARGDASAATVICWVLPIIRPTRESNRKEERFPSKQWAQTRSFGEQFNTALRRHLVAWLEERGYQAVAPQLEKSWHEFSDTPVGIASTWSERHAAYATGLGTFSLNDGLITPSGIAHRVGSVITSLHIEPDERPYPDHRYNCLYYREKSCGLCIARCPAGALSYLGHDKLRCREYVYGICPTELATLYGVPQTGCGLCQTKVPCEGQIPRSMQEREHSDEE